MRPLLDLLAQQVEDLKAELIIKNAALEPRTPPHSPVYGPEPEEDSPAEAISSGEPACKGGVWMQKCAQLVGAYIMEDWGAADRFCAECARRSGLWSTVVAMQNSQD